MTRLTLTLTLTPLLLAGAVAAAPVANPDQATAAARRTLSDTVDEVLEVLRDPEGTHAKLVRLEAITDRRFDFPRMTKLVLGRNRKKLSEEQQAEFQQEFKRHLTITYGRRIEGFAEEQIEIGDARLERNGDVTVKTTIVGGAANGLLVDYRMREGEGSWGIIDVVIEGVSLVQNFRAQIQDIVSSKGADQLILELRAKNQSSQNGAGSD